MPTPFALDALPRVLCALRVALKAEPELVPGRLTRAPGAISTHLKLRRCASLTLRRGPGGARPLPFRWIAPRVRARARVS